MQGIIEEGGSRLDKTLAYLSDLSRSQANDEIKKAKEILGI